MSVKLSSDEDGLMQLEKERLIKRDEEVVEYALESPDGKTAWLFCAIVFLFNFVILGFGYSTAIYLIPISDDLDNGQRGNISLIFGVSSGIVFLASYIGGYLTDRFGVRWVVFGGSGIAALGIVLSSFSQNIWQLFICFSLIHGFGFSLCYLPTISLLGQWFKKYRGLGTGIAVSGSGLGTLIIPILANFLQKEYGWRVSFLIFGELIAIILLIISLPLRRRIAAVSSADYKILEHVKTRAFIILLFSSFFSAFSYFIPYAHLVTYSIDVGIDDNLAALVLSFMGVASIFGRIIIGYLSDKLDRKNIYNFCLFMMAGSCYLWYFSTHIISIIAFGFFYSFFAGSIVSIKSPLMADYFGVELLASLQGLNLFITGLGTALGTAAAGYLYDITGSYTFSIFLCAASLTLSCLSSLLLPPIKKISNK